MKWINVKDELPREGQIVMLVFDQGLIRPVAEFFDDQFWRDEETLEGEIISVPSETVTHWMNFPPPPEGYERKKRESFPQNEPEDKG